MPALAVPDDDVALFITIPPRGKKIMLNYHVLKKYKINY